MIGLDTNVIARYVLNDDDAQFAAAAALFASLTAERPGFISHVSLVELHWVMHRKYKVPREACVAMINKLVEMRQIEFEDGESVVRALALAEDGADFADALIAANGELFGVRETVTFDRHAAKRLGWRLLETASA
jgi:predicted nucleic-acid-binding protein